MVIDYFQHRDQRELTLIILGVCTLHCLLIGWLGYASQTTPQWQAPTKKVIVKTIALAPPKMQNQTGTPTRPVQKKVEKKPVKKKEEIKPQQEKTVKVQNKKQQELLTAAKESINQVQNNRSKMTYQAVSQSVAPETFSEVKSSTDELLEFHYKEELAARLRLFLRLPEYGEVTIRLTLGRMGAVEKLEVLESQSKTNRQYVESSVPSLYFPPFGEHFPGEKNHVFTITLRND